MVLARGSQLAALVTPVLRLASGAFAGQAASKARGLRSHYLQDPAHSPFDDGAGDFEAHWRRRNEGCAQLLKNLGLLPRNGIIESSGASKTASSGNAFRDANHVPSDLSKTPLAGPARVS